MKINNYAIREISSKEGYSALFKAFMLVASLFLISLDRAIDITLPIESEAYELKYVVESELKKELDFYDLTCDFEMKSYKECKLSLYKHELSSSSFGALSAFQALLGTFALFSGIFCIFGFIAHPYLHDGENN